MSTIKSSQLGFALGVSLLGALTGCIGYVEEPRPPVVYAQPQPVYVEQDDYVYYPGYQVYYSGSRHQYIYLEGRSWVSRPAPPHVSIDVLFASPSVRLAFHDSPSAHHAAVVRQYPKQWAPPKKAPSREENRNDEKGNNRGGHGR